MSIDKAGLISSIQEAVVGLAEVMLEDRVEEAKDDTEFFLELARQDLEIWTEQLKTGDLLKEDFEWLIKNQKDLFELVALKQTGLSQIQLDKFKDAALNEITNTVFKLLKV